MTNSKTKIRVPAELTAKLGDYRQRVWIAKVAEAIAIGACCILSAWLAVFLLDRLFDTASSVRAVALLILLLGVAAIPWGLYRWVWSRRTLPQVARLISKKLPGQGDRLLGVLDLVDDRSEQARSPVLVQAAIDQVAGEARDWDLAHGLPNSHHRRWWIQAAVLAAIVCLFAALAPAAIHSAWSRLTSPFGDTPRYTFAAVGDIPNEQVIAHGEPFTFRVPLDEASRWKPESATATIGQQDQVTATLTDGAYQFELPSQIDPATLKLRIGDARREVQLLPTLRPELESVFADVTLPDYLERPETQEHDVRGGAITLVHGGSIGFRATANRELASAKFNGEASEPNGREFHSATTSFESNQETILEWMDNVGLAGKEPFTIAVSSVEDEAPTVSCTGLQRQMVVLVSEQLKFQLQARDDFGVRKVGMQWQGFQYDGKLSSTSGKQVLAAGSPDRETLNATGTFQADALGIPPQPVEMRLFVEDYYPDRQPAVSPPFLLYVLSADEHAIWLTEQLSKWHRRALEVRDRELKLYASNKRIREMSAEQLNDPKVRQMIEQQVRAEKANARRLGDLTNRGEQIIQQATRNPEFGVGHLEKWAEMLQILKDISANRMPSVANLLQDAAEAPKIAKAGKPKESGPAAGVNRRNGSGGAGEEEDDEGNKRPPIPTVADSESVEEFPKNNGDGADAPKKSGGANLSLPATTLLGKAKKGGACPTGESMEEAVEAQEDLLAEFDKVADELNSVLANLEGSTLVKRLKAASRKQSKISNSIGDLLEVAFGSSGDEDDFRTITRAEQTAAIDLSYIMDDMQAYFDRRPFARFKTVLNEMREDDVIGGLRKLADDIPEETGVSMAQCEYWCDTFDRWAEDLVDPASGGT